MAVSKAHLHGRSSNCLRKYRLFFIFGVTILCAQVYLAYTFFALENERLGVSRPSSGEVGSSQVEEVNKGLPKGSRQLKLPPDKEPGDKILPYRNRTRVKLDTRSLNFTPICEITSREAISAVTRAQTQICKQRIVNATCLSQDGSLYPHRIQSSCPNSQGFVGTPKSLGCYKDDKTLRILSGYYAVFKSSNSPEKCAYMCLQSGYVYAGVEYSMECFCGMEEPPRVKRLPDSSCNMQCPGNPKNSCGGFLTINVYSTGIQRFKAQEARNSSLKNTKEPPIRIAYLLTVNGRASRQVKRLISTLYHPSHLFYIHVDARQDYLYREMLEVENSCATNNIKVARGEGLRHASIWGGASLLTTLLTSAHEMLQHPHYWDFLVNLSESDFPVKTNEYLTEFLGWNRGFNFVKSHGREVQRFITKQGLDKTFVECEARMWRVGDRKLPNGIQIDGGSDWVALSRDFVQYVAKKEPDTLVVNLLKIFQYTLLPAESFFHTVLRNSKFCQTYIDNNLHVTNWKRKLGCKCQYKAVVDWCGCSPNDFKLEDFNRIRKTNERNLFFARKFEPMIDQRIIDKVQEWLYPEKLHSMVNSKGYNMYWQSIYHHADLSPPVDDALLTISNSLARIGFQQKLALNSTRVRLLETTVYFKENKFHGVLVRAEVTKNSTTLHGEVKEQFEALVQVKPNFSVNKTWLSGKIKSLEVSTDYDQKEQTFRNLVRSIGPLSNPILGYEFDLDLMVSQNFTVLWVDPSGRLADVNQVQVDESSLIGFVKPQLPNRLSIGKWMVLLVSNSMVISNLSFLVIPLSYWENKRISLEKSKEINEKQSPALYHVTENVQSKLMDLVKSTFTDLKLDAKDHHPFEGELDQWIDSFTQEYYEFQKFCRFSGSSNDYNNANSISKLQKCYDTNWSSLSPDPKSDIRNLCRSDIDKF